MTVWGNERIEVLEYYDANLFLGVFVCPQQIGGGAHLDSMMCFITCDLPHLLLHFQHFTKDAIFFILSRHKPSLVVE